MTPWRALAGAAALLALSGAARAMGNAQECRPEDLMPVDAWIAAHPWRVGPVNPNGLVASACRQSSADKRLTIVAAAYDLAIDNQKSVVVALVDFDAGVVRAAFKGILAEDPWREVAQGSLRLDTAAYDLAPGVRAFGLDVTSSSEPTSCVDAGIGPMRMLFVRDGERLKPVLGFLGISTWRFAGGNPVCDPSHADAVIETTTSTIAIAPHASNGFADLVVTESIDGRAPGRKVRGERYELHYDGITYRRDGKLLPPPLVTPEAPAPAARR